MSNLEKDIWNNTTPMLVLANHSVKQLTGLSSVIPGRSALQFFKDTFTQKPLVCNLLAVYVCVFGIIFTLVANRCFL